MKKWYQSKTLWVNFAAIIVFAAQYLTNTEPLSPDVQAAILAAVNLILRLITNKGLTQ